MPPIDRFSSNAASSAGPAGKLFSITPSDTADLSHVTTAVYVGGGGDLAVQDRETGNVVIFRNMADGAALPIRVVRVMATGTTCTSIVGMG